MGMVSNVLRISSKELDNYLNDSSLLEKSIYEDENPNLIDIDKAWDGIIFLLTGEGAVTSTHPLTKILFSGQLIDEEQDLGYGPAHYLTPEQVSDLNNQISKISVEDLRQKYDPQKMEDLEIYPPIWHEEGDEAFDYLSDFFIELQQEYAEATKNGEGIITFLS